MKASATRGQVLTDSIRVLSLVVESAEDAELLERLYLFFTRPHQRSEAQRLAMAVLASRDYTVAAELIDEAQAELRAVDGHRGYVGRKTLINAIRLIETRGNDSGADPRETRLPVPMPVWTAVLDAIALAHRAEPRKAGAK